MVEIFGVDRVFEEVGFTNLVSDKGSMLRFDIMIPDIPLLCEYNGRGHYHYIRIMHRRRSAFQRLLKHDRRKIEYTRSMGIPFLVISHLDNPGNPSWIMDRIACLLESQ